MTLPLVHDVRRGVGVEGTGAPLGLAAIDLVVLLGVGAVEGEQREVEGHDLGLFAERLGQVPGQGGIDLSFQEVVVGQRLVERGRDHLLVGDTAKSLAGIGERGDACGGGEEDGQEHSSGDPLGVAELEVGLAALDGVAIDLSRGQGVGELVHRTLLE